MTYSLSQIPSLLEVHEFEFPNLPDRLKCMICHKILKNAKQTQCGCKACESCITSYLSNGPNPCPSNQPECANTILRIDQDVNQDNATNKEIGNLKTKCPFKSCSVINSLKNLADHVVVCEFREVICSNCNEKFIEKYKVIHDDKECKMRKANCQYCQSIMKHADLEFHISTENDDMCPKFVGSCPNGCSYKTSFFLKQHLIECVNRKLECPYHSLGCDAKKLPKQGLIKHMTEENINHTSSLISELTDLKIKNETLEKEVKKLHELIQELFIMNEKSSGFRISTEKTIEELKKRNISSATPPTIQTVEKNIIFRNATFIWKFTNFEVRRLEAENGVRVSVTSDPFYTSEFGYKMCLRIYPAGDGLGKGSFLSVFFAIMQGDYDDLLSWPFKQKVTLSILDQEGSSHHSDTFKPDSRSACYQKPIDECNIASGSPKFISRDQVTGTTKFYKNDTIYIKISVDTMGISKP